MLGLKFKPVSKRGPWEDIWVALDDMKHFGIFMRVSFNESPRLGRRNNDIAGLNMTGAGNKNILETILHNIYGIFATFLKHNQHLEIDVLHSAEKLL